MSISSHSSVPVTKEYDLELNNPKMNPQILPMLCSGCNLEAFGITCDKLFIKVNYVDIQDFALKLHSAKLTPDFSGIDITLPRIPYFERNRRDVEGTYKLALGMQENAPEKEKKNFYYCEHVHREHLKLVTQCSRDNYQLRKTVRFNFPLNMKCNNRYFNNYLSDDPFKLKPKILVTTRQGKFEMKFYCVVYELVVEGSVTRYTELDFENNQEEILESYAKGITEKMNGMSMTD